MLGRLEAEGASKDRQAPQYCLLLGSEQIVAPSDGGFERLLATRCDSAPAD
jgi:hypothetical protein